MKIRGLLAGLLVAVALGGCTRSATAPEARSTVAGGIFTDDVIPPPDSTQRTGGTLGSGH